MNFNRAEQLRERLKNNVDELKKVKSRTNQTQFVAMVRTQSELLTELFQELDTLKEDFTMFKLQALSKVENEKQTHVDTKCVTSPFAIYVLQK